MMSISAAFQKDGVVGRYHLRGRPSSSLGHIRMSGIGSLEAVNHADVLRKFEYISEAHNAWNTSLSALRAIRFLSSYEASDNVLSPLTGTVVIIEQRF